MHQGGDQNKQASPQDDAEKLKLEKLREAVHTQIIRNQTAAAAAIRKQALLKDPYSFKAAGTEDESSPGLSPSSSPQPSATSSRRPTSIVGIPSINPGDYPFPLQPDSASATGSDPNFPPLLPRTGSGKSDVTVCFRPSAAADPFTPNLSRRPTYTSWPGPQDFPSPNIYDLTLKMNADIGMESFWENLVEIFVTNFYASRVSLSIPYDLTDITNTPWGLKATYNDSVDKQQTRIKLERRQSQEAPPFIEDSGSDSNGSDTTPRTDNPPKRREKGVPTLSINNQLDSMLNGRAKVYPNLKALDMDDDPLIDNAGVKRVLDRGSIVILSREYRDPDIMRRREEEVLKAHQDELEEDNKNQDQQEESQLQEISSSKQKPASSIRKHVLSAWEQTFFKPPSPGQSARYYDEYEQPLASPWSHSPGPSPAVLKETMESPFFPQNVESSFSPGEDDDYTSSDQVYAIGMENYRSIIHIPLVHPHTSKSISSSGESSGSSGPPPIIPIAIISFLSTVIPYPAHLINSLSSFSPLIATSLSQAIRHSNVLHQLANSPMSSPQLRKKKISTPEERSRFEDSPEDSPVTHSSPGTSETSTPSWDIQGHLFSPAVVEAETPSPFRSTLSTETDYFSHRRPRSTSRTVRHRSTSDTFKSRLGGSESEDIRPSSKSSWSQETAPTEESATEKRLAPVKIYRRTRKSSRMVHSHGATSQFTAGFRLVPRKPKSGRSRTESFVEADPYQMHTPSSRLLKVVVDSIPVHVFTASPGTGTITWANGRTLAYRGVTAEAYIADPHAAIHPSDRDEFLKRWNRMLQLETDGISQSVRIRRFDGEYRWFAARVVPLRDARGGVVHWFGTAMDIHDAREAEINSARQEEIKASELKYRSLAEVSPQIVFAATPVLGISYANSQWMTYSGVTYGDTAHLGFLSFVHPDDRVKCALPAKGNDPQFQVEVRLLSANGAYRWHLVKCVRIEERDGKDDLWLGTCTDIHEHKMLEQRLKESNEAARAAEAEHKKRAEDALETRRQQEFFIDMVSHELRNPLSAIVQSSDVVLDSLRGILADSSVSPTTAQELSDDVETMKSIGLCTMHMRRLIDDTINVSKLESGMLQVTPVDCEPISIVKQIQQIFDAELQSKRIEMVIVQDESYQELDVEWVRADPSRISQILINLLSNAIKFLDNRPERKITLTLSASLTPPKPAANQLHGPEDKTDPDSQEIYLTFSIKDTGPGLKKAEMAALFQRFSQATPRTHVTYGGSGLGLFISKRLVELQSGRIYVDSVENKGSTFTFYIKVGRSSFSGRREAATKSPNFPTPSQKDRSAVPLGRKTHVLVVEDNLINQSLLKKQLIGSGYRVSVANHGQEAFDKVLASQASPMDAIDIILMDVEMPILSGLQATRLLREAEVKGDIQTHIPVIAVSANAREEQKKRMFDAGADEYLTKPFQLPELVARLRQQTSSRTQI